MFEPSSICEYKIKAISLVIYIFYLQILEIYRTKIKEIAHHCKVYMHVQHNHSKYLLRNIIFENIIFRGQQHSNLLTSWHMINAMNISINHLLGEITQMLSLKIIGSSIIYAGRNILSIP